MRVVLGALAALLLLGLASAASAQAVPPPRMSQAEGMQILEVSGFKLVGGKAVNSCGRPTTPKFIYMDLNGDGAPEAIGAEKDPGCYGGTGDRFVVLARSRDGFWLAMLRELGTIRFETTRTRGWLDARIETDCPRIWRYSGTAYESGACIGAAPARPTPTPVAAGGVTAADRTAALRLTGFRPRGGKWVDESGDCEVSIDAEGVRDLNGDGKPEIVVTGSGGYCYGNTGQGYFLTQKTPAGTWRLVDQRHGIPTFLTTRGVGGWVDIEVGGPGFCFPIVRNNGQNYVRHRMKAYQPGACAGR